MVTRFACHSRVTSLDIPYASVKSNCAYRAPAPGHCGAFVNLVCAGGGILGNFVWPGGRAFTYSGAPSELLTRTWFPILIGHFTVVCLVPWPLNRREAGGDLVLLQTCLLFKCKSWYSDANKPVKMIIYI